MGRGAVFMLTAFPVAVLVGTVLGFLSGLGIGGGSLLMLWLTAVVAMPQEEARAVNLLFFLPTALICSLFRRKQGKLEKNAVLPAALTGCIAAGVCAFLAPKLDTGLLRKLFGGLLLLTGIKELCYRPRKVR